MKVPKSVSLDTQVIEQIKTAAKRKRESASKWLEDAALQRLDRELPDKPIMIPKLPTAKSAAYPSPSDEHRQDHSTRGKGVQDGQRSKTKYKKRDVRTRD